MFSFFILVSVLNFMENQGPEEIFNKFPEDLPLSFHNIAPSILLTQFLAVISAHE